MNLKKKATLVLMIILGGLIFINSVYSSGSSDKFVIVVLPDTQNYAEHYPAIATNQTQWIVDNKDSLNIKYVISVGDLVNTATDTAQWDNINTSYTILDGSLSYTLVPGNHDYADPSTFLKNLTSFDTYFPVSRYSYDGTFPSNSIRNNYRLLTIEGEDYIVLGIEFCPNNTVIEWANDTLTTYESRNKIIITHSYMYCDGTRVNKYIDSWSCGGYGDRTGNDGDDIYEEIIAHHTKVRLVLSGHILNDGLGRRMDVVSGYPVNQILQNYQMKTNGGNGWLRYYEFDIDNNKVNAKTYSPHLGIYNTTSENEFSLYWDVPNN